MNRERIASCQERSSQFATLVVGLGNPLRGDDGVGPRVVEALDRRGVPPGVTLLDAGTGGLGLLNALEGWDRVVVVDAAEVGGKPGDFVRFTPDEARLTGTPEHFTLHHAGLAEVLAIARALDRPLPPMVIFGVQPEVIDWRDGLSPSVEATLPELVEAILCEVGEDDAQDPGS